MHYKYSKPKIRPRLKGKPFVKKVKAIIVRGREKKWYDKYSGGAGVGLTQASTAVQLLQPAQGDGANARDGDRIELRSIRVTMHVRQSDAIVESDGVLLWSNLVRLLIVQWKASGIPALSDILDDAAAIQNLQSPYKMNPTNKFKVLFDRRFNLVSPNNTGAATILGVPARVNLSYTSRAKQLFKSVRFDPAATTGINKIFLFGFSNSATRVPDLFYHSRILYTDS